MTPGADDDTVIGGPGRDSVSYRSAPGPVTVDLRLTDPQPTGWGSDTLRGVEAVQGTDRFSNHLVGNARDNDLSGGNVDVDILRGGGGSDWVGSCGGEGSRDHGYGGAGDDELYAYTSDETLDGGEGFDVLSYANVYRFAGPGVTVDLALGGPQDTVYSGTDEIADVEGPPRHGEEGRPVR